MISICGATGFIGGHLFERLINRAIVVPRDQRTMPSRDIVYLISTCHNYNVYHNIHKDVNTNLTVLLEHLGNLKPGDTFNFISSWFVYGNVLDLPAEEDSPCDPTGFYSITKRAAEQLVISYCKTFNIDYRILRLCNVYGPGDKPTAKKNALQYLIEEMRLGHPISLYNKGEFYRDYMHVKDICAAIELVVDKAEKNCILNIGGGEPLLFKDIIDYAKRQLKVTVEVGSTEPSEFHKIVQAEDFYMDTTRLKNLGFKQTISIEKGLRELCR